MAVLVLLGAASLENQAAAIRINEEPAKTAEEKSTDELANSTKVKEGQSPYCALEGKACREREGYKKSDDEGNDDDLEEPKGMVRSTPTGFTGDSEANKASKGESKELIMNSTVKVEMTKWMPNKVKEARMNATKKAIKEEEKQRKADKEKRKLEREERKKKREADRKKAAKAQLNTTAKAQTN